MFDLRPIFSVLGLFIVALGLMMSLPAFADAVSANEEWRAFVASMFLTLMAGGAMIAIGGGKRGERLSIQQTFLLTVGAWLLLPLFGALPFIMGAAELSFTNAFFEAMSGITTTGATVLEGLDEMAPGTLLWRGLLQWIGGLGIVVVAIAILPELKVGGMQLFKSEAFDTFGKILPQAASIAAQLTLIYVMLTFLAILVYAAAGMMPFDALVHAMTTIATGGLANYDESFGIYSNPVIHYAAAAFMFLSALPYVRFVQLANGAARPLFRDTQIRAFAALAAIVVLTLTVQQWQLTEELESSFRAALFNVVSILTGTGYATEDFGLWGPFAMMVFFLIALIGGCAGSTSCSVKVFRYQVLAAAVRTQINLIHNPSSVRRTLYEGRPVSDAVLSSVMAFFMLFFVSLGLVTIALSLAGLDLITALTGAVACQCRDQIEPRKAERDCHQPQRHEKQHEKCHH